MSRRMILLFVLFLVVALFYSVVIQQVMPNIKAKQKAQTEMMNNLDEQALAKIQSGNWFAFVAVIGVGSSYWGWILLGLDPLKSLFSLDQSTTIPGFQSIRALLAQWHRLPQ